jgi:hypothetical protein
MCKLTFSYLEGWQQRLPAKVLLRLHQQFNQVFIMVISVSCGFERFEETFLLTVTQHF